jgi:thiol-disulfide isomerase/thioredoxin
MKELKRSEDVKKLLTSSKPVAIFFYLDGCPHCETMDPVWSELEKDTPGVEFVKVESASVPAELGISGFPKFVKISGGREVSSVNGEVSKEELKTKLLGSKGGRRRRALRLKRTRRKHAIHRSTRRHIPFRTKFSSTR